jgi:hypothetical protein
MTWMGTGATQRDVPGRCLASLYGFRMDNSYELVSSARQRSYEANGRGLVWRMCRAVLGLGVFLEVGPDLGDPAV